MRQFEEAVALTAVKSIQTEVSRKRKKKNPIMQR
jgi:hypothetical protein